MNPNANIFDHKKKDDLKRLDKMLDDDVHPVNGNKLFGKGSGFKEPIRIEDGDDSGAHSLQPELTPHALTE